MINKLKKLLKDTGLFLISSFGSKVLLFLLTPLYTSILTTTDYGTADLINTTILFVYPVLTLAISDATLRFALEKCENKNEVFCCSLFFVFTSTIILLISSPFFIDNVGVIGEYWLYFVLTYFLFNLHNVYTNFIKGIGKTSVFAIQGIIQTISIIVANILTLIVFRFGLEGYLISIIIGYLIPIIYVFVSCQLFRYHIPFTFSKKTCKKMLVYSLPMIPTLLAWSINSSIDKYMLTYYVGVDENGIYSVAHKIPTLISTVLAVFLQAWQISAIESLDNDSSAYYSKVYRYMDFFCVVGCACVIVLTKLLASILFANDFYQAWKYVPLLIISTLFSSNAGFIASIFRATKKTTNLLVSVVIGALVNIVLNFVLIEFIGPIGAAYATAISFMFVWGARIIMVQKIVKLQIPIVRTFLSYLIIIAEALLFTYEVDYCYLICIFLIVLLLVININDISKLIKYSSRYLKKRKLL